MNNSWYIVGLLCASTISCTTTSTEPLNGSSTLTSTHLVDTIVEKDAIIVFEAENYASQTLNESRQWLSFSETNSESLSHNFADADLPHLDGASNGEYLEILPDTRTNHDEALIPGENFTDKPGEMAILSYPIYVTTPGRYYVWARAYSTGTEDNGMHIGLNGDWPESGQRLQFCKGKFAWTWSSQQRRPDNHCGDPTTLWIDIDKPGQHMLTVSMREDGTEIDKFILTQDKNYTPVGMGPSVTTYNAPELSERTALKDITHYYKILDANTYFTPNDASKEYFYFDEWRKAAAINAGKPDARNIFVRASYEVPAKLPSKALNMQLVTLSEIDGESSYRVFINDQLIGEFTNAETTIDYSENTFDLGLQSLKQGDTIHVEANAVTNGKIPEGDITAFSRGRWRALVLQHPPNKR